jgi:hypothetical protein
MLCDLRQQKFMFANMIFENLKKRFAESRSFQMKSEILIGVWGGASTSFCCRQEARECTFFKVS